MQCKAKSKRSGQQCQRHAMIGKTVCHMHGGKTRGGMASPVLKHGRYSKFLPTHLMERYQESLNDSDLLSLREEIALIDARLSELLAGGVPDWDVMVPLTEQRRKLVDTERRRLVDMQQMITTEQAMLLVSALTSILREEVTDTYVLARIQTRIAGVLVPKNGNRVDASEVDADDGSSGVDSIRVLHP